MQQCWPDCCICGDSCGGTAFAEFSLGVSPHRSRLREEICYRALPRYSWARSWTFKHLACLSGAAYSLSVTSPSHIHTQVWFPVPTPPAGRSNLTVDAAGEEVIDGCDRTWKRNRIQQKRNEGHLTSRWWCYLPDLEMVYAYVSAVNSWWGGWRFLLWLKPICLIFLHPLPPFIISRCFPFQYPDCYLTLFSPAGFSVNPFHTCTLTYG